MYASSLQTWLPCRTLLFCLTSATLSEHLLMGINYIYKNIIKVHNYQFTVRAWHHHTNRKMRTIPHYKMGEGCFGQQL